MPAVRSAILFSVRMAARIVLLTAVTLVLGLMAYYRWLDWVVLKPGCGPYTCGWPSASLGIIPAWSSASSSPLPAALYCSRGGSCSNAWAGRAQTLTPTPETLGDLRAMTQGNDTRKIARGLITAASLACIAFGIRDMLRSLRQHS
jgi:hypothetical protein